MSESEHRVVQCATGGVAGEALIEHVDEPNPRVPFQRILYRRRRDNLAGAIDAAIPLPARRLLDTPPYRTHGL